MRRIVAAAVFLALAACASEPRRVAESPPTVSYSFTGDSLDEASRKAQDYCEHYSLDARLLDVDRRSTDNVAHFECR